MSVQNDTNTTQAQTPRVTVANTAPDTEAPELTARQKGVHKAMVSFTKAAGRLPKTGDISSPLGKEHGLPSRYTIDRTYGELKDGAWVNGWSLYMATNKEALTKLLPKVKAEDAA